MLARMQKELNLFTLLGMRNRTATMGNNLAVSYMHLPYDPVFALWAFMSKKWKLLLHTHTQACMWLLKAVLLVIVFCNNPSNILQQVVKNCNISIPWNTYYSAVKLNDLFLSAVTQVYSKRIMLSEKIQSQKLYTVWSHLHNTLK